MELGVSLPCAVGTSRDTDWLVPPDRLVRFAERAEEFGFSSVYNYDHLTPPPYYGYEAALDPLISLAAIARETETVRLGTNILILPLRNPVLVASRAATLQHFAPGRLTIGLGAGYVEAEYEAANVPFEERYARFHEGIELVYRLLNDRNVTFEGRFWQVDDLTIEPFSSKSPRLLAGGTGATDDDGNRSVATPVMARVDITDGWIAGPWAPEAVRSDWDDIATYIEAQGGDPLASDRAMMTFTHLFPNHGTEGARERQKRLVDRYSDWGYANQHYALGSVDDVVERLGAYEDIGIEEVVLTPIAAELHDLDRQLERWANLLLPHFH